MVSCFVSLWMAAALGQAPAGEAAWLKSVPADVAAVVRVKALETGRDDLMKMLESMSGNAAAMAKGPIDQGMETFTAMHGKPAAQHPFFTILRLPKDGRRPAVGRAGRVRQLHRRPQGDRPQGRPRDPSPPATATTRSTAPTAPPGSRSRAPASSRSARTRP